MKAISLILTILLFKLATNHINSQQVNHNRELFDKYVPIYDYDISGSDETGIVLETSSISVKYDCFRKCSSRSDCLMISYKINQCKLYSQVKYTASLTTNTPYLFEKVIEDYSAINDNLIHHWPMNNNYNDIIGGKTLINPVGVSFITDRLNSPSSAISINYGYIQAPAGVYFSGDFTVTTWFRSDTALVTNCRLFDFGNGQALNNILVSWASGKSYITTFTGSSTLGNRHSNNLVKIGKWNHFALTFKTGQLTLYINGNVDVTGTAYTPTGVSRTSNYIGRGNWPCCDPLYCYGSFDDFKIFNRSLSQSELLKVMNSYY